MSHPTLGDLLELPFGELDEGRANEVAAHLGRCPACRALVADVEWAEQAMTPGPDEAPPPDGLERVLRRLESARPARVPASPVVRAVLPSAAALVAGSLAVAQGGVAAALAFFVVGAIVTLSVAPVLILESQRRPR